MFTGIVERTAEVEALVRRQEGAFLRLEVRDATACPPWRPVVLGESIAIDGVCLTVVEHAEYAGGGRVAFEAVPETLERTTLGHLKRGDRVNVERSLRMGDPLGGHQVSGHVDGTAVVRLRQPRGSQVLFQIAAAASLLRFVIPKGSVAVDGVSLTVVDVDREAGWFSFAAIPHTLAWTTLTERTEGAAVNLEVDVLGKWILRGLDEYLGGPSGPVPGGSSVGRLEDLVRRTGFLAGGGAR